MKEWNMKIRRIKSKKGTMKKYEIGFKLHYFISCSPSFSWLARYKDQCWHWTTVRSNKLPVQWYGVFKRWSLVLCNFPEYPRLRGSRGYSLVSRPGPHILITAWGKRECKFYNLSVIIWCAFDFWRVSCHPCDWQRLSYSRGETKDGKQSCLETSRQA